jgi:monooxygenase
MTTLGYGFNPWQDTRTIAHGSTILSYLQSTAIKFGIDKLIRYNEKVLKAAWSSADGKYTLEVRNSELGVAKIYTCNFLFMCTGYYDYENPYTPPEFDTLSTFNGPVIHPQCWDPNLDYSDKKIVVIGSGATAVTLIPSLVKPEIPLPGCPESRYYAKHVTMLQRSPTYIISLPSSDPTNLAVRKSPYIPVWLQNWFIFWRSVVFGVFLYWSSMRDPARMKAQIIKAADANLNKDREPAQKIDVEKHFTPRYDPWEQRMCITPDKEFFNALRSGRCAVKTDLIKRFVKNGIELSSGELLEADIIITATGLTLKLLGGIDFSVDGQPVRPSDSILYRDMMLTGLPNAMMCIGYVNASWTLKCDLTTQLFCRVINHMAAKGFRQCEVVATEKMETNQVLALTSGYIARAKNLFPMCGDRGPWRRLNNYLMDFFNLNCASVVDSNIHYK